MLVLCSGKFLYQSLRNGDLLLFVILGAPRMHVFQRFYKFFLFLSGFSLLSLGWLKPLQASACPDAALSQMTNHRVTAGETLEGVAAQYGLRPATLAAINPQLPAQGALPTGGVVEVPPFNGVPVQVGAGQTWQSLAERHGTRADLLFEVNGCPDTLPSRVFIPAGNRGGTMAAETTPSAVALGYPLPVPAKLVLSYGWQPHPRRDELVFNSGIAFSATPGTVVTSAADGTVAFVGEHNGALIMVVNHSNGLQTRYGNLADVEFTVGDAVTQGTGLGTVAGESQDSFMYFEVRTNSSEGWIARDPGQYLSELELQQ
ncbi:M23 family metallopeptidase [Leptolyngbyaceae cyanobacterium CCMR0082]|uniref:M23 family metallopeptidase n=2 Tax=Adonisia TaxID=2950183 RepID=A0A6M0S6Y5_9CYAN|nr:M23 family metallopeptidase [Adonisia turfae CCMR0082]